MPRSTGTPGPRRVKYVFSLPPRCACGCGAVLPRVRYHGRMRLIYGDYPRFVVGHAARDPKIKALFKGRPDVTSRWLEENQGRLICQCGCGTPIQLQREYHYRGVPAYAHGHHPNSHLNRCGGPGDNLNRRKFRVAERVLILVNHDFRCAECGWGGKDKVQHLEIDHVVPFSRGGQTIVENGQPLCVPCHAGKSKVDNKTRRVHTHVNQRGV